jgi:hypothetical protein
MPLATKSVSGGLASYGQLACKGRCTVQSDKGIDCSGRHKNGIQSPGYLYVQDGKRNIDTFVTD